MRLAALCLLSTCAAWPQFRSTVPLVVAPTTVKDAQGHFVDGLDSTNLILYDNNVPRPIQADIASYPISLVVAVQASKNSAAILDKLGNSGILFSQLLAADQGETALITFSHKVTVCSDFTNDPDDLTHELQRLHAGGTGAATLDGLRKALEMLSQRKTGRRLIVLMIAENRDRSSESRLPELVQEVQHLNAAVYWLTYSSILAPYTNRKGKTDSKGNPLPADSAPMDLLGPFTTLAHLTKPNIANLFTRLTGAQNINFLTKRALENSIHAIGEEIHREYILTFQPAPGPAGLFHTIRVEVKDRPDLKATTRQGFWAVQ